MKNYPYELAGTINEIQLIDVQLDSTPIKEVVHTDNQEIHIYSANITDWEHVKFTVKVNFPENYYSHLVKSDEKIRGCIQIQCADTGIRLKFGLKESTTDSSIWTGKVKVNTMVFGGRAIVRTIFWLDSSNSEESRYICRSNNWTVRFDEASPFNISGFFEFEWVDFNDPQKNNEIPAQYHNQPYYLILTREPPKVWLNESIERLKLIMKDGPLSNEREESLRTMLTMQLVTSIYNAAYAVSIAAVYRDEESEEIEFPSTPWKGQLLKEVLTEIYPNETTTDALTKLYDEWREGEADFVESQLQSMITSKLNYQKAIRTVIQTLEQSEELTTQ